MEKQVEIPQRGWINLINKIVEQIENTNESISLIESEDKVHLKIDKKEVFSYDKKDGSFIFNKNEMGVLNKDEEEILFKSLKNAILSFSNLEGFTYQKEERWFKFLR
jgi:hypothetical protein